jgi:hypothetical protein
VRARPLFRLTLLFAGLAALFAGLNLAVRGHPGFAAAASVTGAAAAGVAARALAHGAAADEPGDADPDAGSGPVSPGGG